MGNLQWSVYHSIMLVICLCGVHSADSTIVCPTDYELCNLTIICIPSKYLCDGTPDCIDSEDEQNCGLRESGCGNAALQTGSNGSFSSMGYPLPYKNLASCRWQIQVDHGYTILIRFDPLFELESPRRGICVYDSVKIYQDDPPTFIGSYCGKSPPLQIEINSNNVTVVFVSDRQTVGKGFRLTWYARASVTRQLPSTTPTPQCTNVINKFGTQGEITLPHLYDVEPNSPRVQCRWLIQVREDNVVVLSFKSFFLGYKCFTAKINIYDGSNDGAPLLASLCKGGIPRDITSTSNTMYIKLFVLESKRSDKLFTASYHAQPKPTTTTPPPPIHGCDGNPVAITEQTGWITSPFFDNKTPYQKNMNCQWNFIAHPEMVYTFTFTIFRLENSINCIIDYLKMSETRVENGTMKTTELKVLCGTSLPLFDIAANEPNVTLVFHSDDRIQDIGFNMTYSMGPVPMKCNDTEFKCGENQCINISLVCNGHMDCADGSDEIMCPNITGCGIAARKPALNDPRIVGGDIALDGSWPWVAAVLGPSGKHKCGATLVHPHWVITAAHCLDAVTDGKYDSWSVIAGRYQKNHTDRHEQRRNVAKFIRPKLYSVQSSFSDIALLFVKQPFNMTANVGIACLPLETITVGEYGWILGWGETQNDSCCEGKLKQATLPVLRQELCSSEQYYGKMIKEHMMCAGYPGGGTDTCEGDSGGPFVRRRSIDGRWEIQGVTSWGLLCARPKKPGVYTIVNDFTWWIRRSVADFYARSS